MLFHAAAYKHVPLMEAQPEEAVRTNIGGTRVVADLAVKHGVKEFVLISTDKAVNPTSVMGASKRVAELCVRAMQRNASGTRFVTTRFGNVLGSSGSVIPLFRRQIAAGAGHSHRSGSDPLLHDHSRSVSAGAEAATMGRGGEIYVFDMGDPVRIQDLAERMIRLSGKEPGIDIAIVHTGLRPGEKRYEELLASKENTLPTHHPTILIGKDEEAPDAEVQGSIDALIAAAEHETDDQLVARMKALVPEYRSNNSVFSALDRTA
ncbi:MAG: polysaccharide biosynthesis protein [Flavobacteriales bacterium]|nr:polysaccharide biosynthesis protein [Flavobacteriales bacterium]